MPAGTSGIIISMAKTHTHITIIVVNSMFFTEVIPFILKNRDTKYHIRNRCDMANAPICQRKMPFAPITSPTAAQSRAVAICHGETHKAEMRRDATGYAILNGMAVLVKNSMHKSRYINETAASFMYDVVCFAIFVVCELLYTKVENKIRLLTEFSLNLPKFEQIKTSRYEAERKECDSEATQRPD